MVQLHGSYSGLIYLSFKSVFTLFKRINDVMNFESILNKSLKHTGIITNHNRKFSTVLILFYLKMNAARVYLWSMIYRIDSVPVKISILNWVKVERAVWNMVNTRATCVTRGLPILRRGKWDPPAPVCWFLLTLFWFKTFLKAATRFLWSSAGESCRGLGLHSSRSANGRHSVSR